MRISEQVRVELASDMKESNDANRDWITENFGRMCLEDPLLAVLLMPFGPTGMIAGVIVWEAMQRQARLDELAKAKT